MAQDNASSSSVGQRCHKVGHPSPGPATSSLCPASPPLETGRRKGLSGWSPPSSWKRLRHSPAGKALPGQGAGSGGIPGVLPTHPLWGPGGSRLCPSPEHAAWLLEEKPVEGQAPLSRSSPQILTGPERLLKRCEGRESKRNIDVRNISTRTGDPTRHLPVVYWMRLQPAGPHLPGTVSGIWRLLLQVLVAAFLRLSRFQGSCSPRSLRRVKKITDTVCPDFSCRKDGNDHI